MREASYFPPPISMHSVLVVGDSLTITTSSGAGGSLTASVMAVATDAPSNAPASAATTCPLMGDDGTTYVKRSPSMSRRKVASSIVTHCSSGLVFRLRLWITTGWRFSPACFFA